jgi:hypothetical protein
MLDGLFVTPAVASIVEALAQAASGPIAVIGNAKLAQALAANREVIPVGLTPRAAKSLAKKASTNLAEPRADLAAIEPATLAGIVGVDVTIDDSWQATLRAWSRVIRDGGALVLVDRGRATEASRRALCAGLTELEQRHAGRAVITSGLVTHL